MPTAALIVAAGRGLRAMRAIAATGHRGPEREAAAGPTTLAPGSASERSAPKQYAMLAGETVLARTIRAFSQHPRIDAVQVVIHADDTDLYRTAIAHLDTAKLLAPVVGGATRQQSVANGLDALALIGADAGRASPAAAAIDHVLIHDAARPFVSAGTIAGVLEALETTSGAIAAVPLADTLKQADVNERIAATLPREGLWRAQTPQGFRFAAIRDSHARAAAAGRTDFTDDAAIAEWTGLDVALVTDDAGNFKITTPEDMTMAEQRVAAGAAAAMEPRTGTGFDVHKFAPGDHVWLCGVRVPHVARLDGHSDADVGLHALTDAILGALGDGDIGQHFPPSDPRWRGAASHIFLEDAARRVREAGGRIVNVDVTLICEAPRIGPNRDAMREAIARMLGIDMARVGVKATTSEGLGFAGRREGIAAMAAASLLVPAPGA